MSDSVPNGTAEGSAETRKRAAASKFLPIVRGRLPLIFVHAIRFDSVLNAMGNKDLASKFGTSVGKVFDIKKGRNFSYVGEDYKPTAEDLAAAQNWINQVGAENAKGLTASGDPKVMSDTLTSYKERGVASPAEIAALSAAKASTKKPRAPKAAGAEPVQASAAGGALLS